MQNEKHPNQELSEDEFLGGFDVSGADKTKAKQGEERTASKGR